MSQVFSFGLDITQIKAGLAELVSLQNQIFSNQPPAALANIAPPNLPTSFAGGSPNEALQNVARITGAYESALRRLQAEGSITSAQQSQLLGASQNVAGAIPSPLNAPKTQEFFANAQGAGVSEADARAIRAEYLSATGSLNKFKGDEAAFAEKAGQVARKNLGISEETSAAFSKELLTQDQIAEALNEKNLSLRKQIVKLQAELGMPISQGLEGASTQELASLQQSLVNTRRIRNAAEQQSAKKAAANAALEDTRGSYLTNRTPAGTTALPTDLLRSDAAIGGAAAAEDRQIAVAFGQAKQAAYYEQIKYNEVFAKDLAEEEALRQARIGIEKQNLAAELDRKRADGTTARGDVVSGEVAQKTGNARQTADVNTELAANQEYIDAKVANAQAHLQETAAVAESQAANPEYIAAKVAATEAQLLERAAIISATTETQIASRAKIVADEKIVQSRIKTAEAEALGSEAVLQAEAQRVVAERARAQALNRAVASELSAQGAPRFEVAQALNGGGRGGGAGGQDAASFFTGGFLNTIKYALPATLIFGAVSGIKDAIQEAQKLQKIFAQLDAQAQSLGQTQSLGQLKESIMDISVSSGTAASEVADLAFQFQGAFGGDTQKTIKETTAAVEAVKVTGLSLKETIDAFTAITQSFKGTGVEITDITDTALGLQERFGVLAKETISFAADLAPVGAQVGLTAEKIETLGAVSQKYSGRSGSGLAEAFGRSLPQLQKNAVEIVGLFDQIGKGDVSQSLANSFGTGQTGAAFETLLKNYKELTQAQKDFVIEQIGGRREAAALIPVLEHADEYFGSIAKGQNDAGKSAQYYAEIQKTLSFQLGVLSEKLKQVAINIFQGGFGQALSALVTSGTAVIGIFGGILDVAFKVNSALGNIPITVLSLIGVLKGLEAVYNVVATAVGRFISVRKESTIATEADTAAESTNSAVRSRGTIGNFASNVASNYRASTAGAGVLQNAVTTPTGSLAGADLGVIAVGSSGIASLNAEASVAAKASSLFGSTVGRAATGVGAFANALPAPLVFAGAAFAVVQLITTINDIRTAAASATQDLENKILNQDPEKQKDSLNKLRGTSYTPFESIAGYVSGTPNAADIADKIESRLTQKGALAQTDVLSNLSSGRYGVQFERALAGRGGFSSGVADLQKRIQDNPDDKKARDDLQKFIDDFTNQKTTVNGHEIKIGDLKTPTGVSLADLLKDRYTAGNKIADDEKKKQDDAAKAGDALKAKFESINTDLSSIRNQISSGDLSVGEGLAQINSNISEYERFLKEDPHALDNIENAQQKYQEFKKARVELLSSAVLGEAEQANKLIDVTGSGNIESKVSNLTTALKSGQLNKADSKKATDDLLSSYKDLYDYRLNAATGLQEQLDIIKNGIKIDDGAKIGLVQEQLDQADVAFQQYISNQGPSVGKIIAESTSEIAKIIVERGESVKQATIDALRARVVQENARIETLKKLKESQDALKGAGFRDVGEVDSAIAAATKDRDSAQQGADNLQKSDQDLGVVNTPDAYNPNDAAARDKEAAKRTREFNDAKRAYYKALYSGDSVRAAQEDLDSANEELSGLTQGSKEWYEAAAKVEQAKKQLHDATVARERGKIEYLKSLNNDDPVAQAGLDVNAAQLDLNNATPDDYDQKKAALNNAVYQRRQAVLDLNKAASSYYQQLFSDDSVLAAEEGVRQAQRDVAASKPGTTAYYSALTQLDSAQKQIKSAVETRNQAIFSYYKQVFSDDPLTSARISVSAAKEAVSQAKPGTDAFYQALSQQDAAQKQERDALEANDRAHADYLAAVVSGDSIRSAEAAQNKAAYDIAHAHSEADKLQALAAKISADRQMQDALNKLYASQSDLLNAQSDYVGDTVAVAQRGLQDALKKVSQSEQNLASGAGGQAEVNQAKAEAQRAAGSQRDAILKKRQDDYDFQYQMGQITKSQYIQYLEGLKALADGNQTIIRDLDLKIKGLKDDLGADLQFNLPSNIGLPTLYEARRLNQSVGASGTGIGYQDNRQVAITVNVNNGMDLQQVQNILSDALGNTRFGTETRRY